MQALEDLSNYLEFCREYGTINCNLTMGSRKILIAGDSFSADWTVKYTDRPGWTNWLAEKFNVVNVSQAGAGEYKILQQIKKQDLSKFDSIIISHASPNRVYCVKHPIHDNDTLHKNADIIYADIKEHTDNPDAVIAANYYERYFDFNYYQDVSNMCCLEILNLLGDYPNLNQYHMVNYAQQHKYDCLPENFNLNEFLSKYPGNICHLSSEGNKLLYNNIVQWIEQTEDFKP